jgi:hypothetical protein
VKKNKKNKKKVWKNLATASAVTLTLGSQLVNVSSAFAEQATATTATQTSSTQQSTGKTQTTSTEQSTAATQTTTTQQSTDKTQTTSTQQSADKTKATNAEQSAKTGQSTTNTKPASTTDSSQKDKKANSLGEDFDESITTLSLKVTNKTSEKKATLNYSPAPDATDPYQGGELVGHARVPLEGDIVQLDNTDNYGNHVRDFENGNYGSRVNVTLPKGVDAKALYQTIDWEKSNASLKSDFFIKILNAPTFFHLYWGLTWDQSSVRFDPNKPNEFSIVLRGINKDKVSSTEWNKYNPGDTYSALWWVSLAPLGNIEGWAEGSLYFDINQYTGNTDDLSKDKVLTKDRLMPTSDRTFEVNISALDRYSLIAGSDGTGAGDISKALVKSGHEHDNTLTTNSVDTWSDYLSIWDKEGTYNTNTMEEPEIPGVNSALPGKSIVDRDLVTKPGEDFSKFAQDRFNRVINYFTKQDVTNGNVGDVYRTNISHTPSNVPVGQTTAVKYTGSVTYLDGSTRQLMPNILNVTNSKKTDYTLNPKDYTVDEDKLTGTYGADVKEVHLFVNGKDIATATLSNGTFTFTGLAGKIKAEDTVTVAAMEGTTKKNEVPVTVKDRAHDYSLNPKDYTVDEDKLTGTYGADVKEVHLFVNDKDIATATLSNGTFTFTGLAGKIKAKDTVTVAAMEGTTKKNEVPVTVKEGEHNYDYSLSIDKPYTMGENDITGKYGADIAHVRLKVNGTIVKQAEMNAEKGTYDLKGVSGLFKETDDVKVIGVNKNYEEVNSVDLDIKGDEPQPDYSLSIDKAYTMGENDITGKYGADIAHVRLKVNGTIVKQAEMNAEKGTYDLKGVSGLFKETDDVEVIGVDKGYNEVKSIPLKINSYKLTVDHPYTMGENDITGEYGNDIAHVRLEVNGTIVKQAAADEKKHTYDLKGVKGLFKKTDDVKVIGVDSGYKQVKEIPLKIK